MRKVYEFGKNWQQFLDENFNDERVGIATKHLLNRLQLENLEGFFPSIMTSSLWSQ